VAEKPRVLETLLSVQELNKLKEYLSKYHHYFIQGRVECGILTYIIDRTVWRGYADAEVSVKNFQGEYDATFLGIMNADRSDIWKKKKKLEEKYIVEIVKRKLGSLVIENARLNLPGILAYLEGLMVRKRGHCNNDQQEDVLEREILMVQSIRGKVGQYWRSRNWEEAPVNMEDAMKKGKERSVCSHQKKARKRLQAPANRLVPMMVYELMQDYSREFGVKFADRTTAKVRGQMRNFLKEMEAKGEDPRKLLREVVEKWPEMSRSLSWENGTQIGISVVVSFSQFYKYLTPILKWLEAHRDVQRKSAGGFVVTDYSEKRVKTKGGG